MLASNKKGYGVSFFGSFLFHSFSLFFSGGGGGGGGGFFFLVFFFLFLFFFFFLSPPPPPPTLRLEYRNVLYTHAYTADWPKAHHEQSVDM